MNECFESECRCSDVSILFSYLTRRSETCAAGRSQQPLLALYGALTGAVAGGLLAWLVGTGSISIPAAQQLLAAAPFVGALAGVSLGGATGGFAESLTHLRRPDYRSLHARERLRAGGFVFVVHADDRAWARDVQRILKHADGQIV